MPSNIERCTMYITSCIICIYGCGMWIKRKCSPGQTFQLNKLHRCRLVESVVLRMSCEWKQVCHHQSITEFSTPWYEMLTGAAGRAFPLRLYHIFFSLFCAQLYIKWNTAFTLEPDPISFSVWIKLLLVFGFDIQFVCKQTAYTDLLHLLAFPLARAVCVCMCARVLLYISTDAKVKSLCVQLHIQRAMGRAAHTFRLLPLYTCVYNFLL